MTTSRSREPYNLDLKRMAAYEKNGLLDELQTHTCLTICNQFETLLVDPESSYKHATFKPESLKPEFASQSTLLQRLFSTPASGEEQFLFTFNYQYEPSGVHRFAVIKMADASGARWNTIQADAAHFTLSQWLGLEPFKVDQAGNPAYNVKEMEAIQQLYGQAKNLNAAELAAFLQRNASFYQAPELLVSCFTISPKLLAKVLQRSKEAKLETKESAREPIITNPETGSKAGTQTQAAASRQEAPMKGGKKP